MHKHIKYFCLLIYLFGYLSSYAQEYDHAEINWLSWEEAIQKSKIEKRKIFVDLYTKWCTWCKKMEASTFQQPDIARFINERYYPVKFDAQFKDPVIFNNKVYKYKNGYHELATKITMGSLRFPSVIFLDEDFSTIQSIPGFRKKDELEMILVYFADDHHLSTPWSLFQNKYARHKNMGIPDHNHLQQVKGKN